MSRDTQVFSRNTQVPGDQRLQPSHSLGAHPSVPSVIMAPLYPKARAGTHHPSKSGSGNPSREEVKLASDRGCKAASHAHCTGWHQEIKLPRHGLQQRSKAGKAGGTDRQTVCKSGWMGVRNYKRTGGSTGGNMERNRQSCV